MLVVAILYGAVLSKKSSERKKYVLFQASERGTMKSGNGDVFSGVTFREAVKLYFLSSEKVPCIGRTGAMLPAG